MTTPVKVAVYIDRGEAIRAGRNKWGWQTTKIDLETLDASLREALSRCPEKRGALLITHSVTWPGARESGNAFTSATVLDSVLGVRDAFEVERDGMPFLVEATPATALQMLEHLASLPSRLRAKGAELLSSAEAQAATRSAQAMDQVDTFLADVDRWLSTAPDQLFTEHEDEYFSIYFERVEAPPAPTLANVEDEQIVYDLEEAGRLLDGQRPRLGTASDEDAWPSFRTSNRRKAIPPPQYLAAAEEALARGIFTRKEAVKQHRLAIAAAEEERSRAWHAAKQVEAEEERRIAAAAAQQAMEARKDAASNQALREWAVTCEKPEILKLLDDGAPAEQITETLRSILFEPLTRFAGFKKITKQDLLIANPNLDDKASGLKAVFDDVEVEFTDPGHHAAVQAIVQATWKSSIPAQFDRRLHRGRLTRRGETVGVPVEARSLLLTAHFGDLKISRAFAIGIVGPAE